jgi:anti-sigma regulatory factor (Ser/Thr protein kinase)
MTAAGRHGTTAFGGARVSTAANSEVVESGGHALQLYPSDDDLIATLSTYLADGVFAGGLGIAVATPAHLAQLASRLATVTEASPAPGTVLLLDAGELLDRFLVGGRPDRGLFEATVGELVAAACDAVQPRILLPGAADLGHAPAPGPVHIFGEMVALLWADDRVGAALELEELWNGLRRRHDFSLLCAYPASIAGGDGSADAVDEVCRLHTSVLAPAMRPQAVAATRSPPAAAAPAPASGPSCERRHAVRAHAALTAPTAAHRSPRQHQHPAPPRRRASTSARRHFPAEVGAPREVRRFVVGLLTGDGQEQLAHDAALVASELATNAVLHARSSFSITIAAEDGWVRLAVQDDSPVVPRRRGGSGPATAAASGRGLHLVDALTTSWGVQPTDKGKVVWADLTA